MPTYAGSDGTPLYYATGPPVVVLAGGAARHPSYLGDLAGLSDRFPLLVPHLRGVGRSPVAPDERGSFWRQAEDLDLLRTHLGLDRLTLVAHSAGTRLAIAYAAQFPDRLDGMALITPPAGYLVDVPPPVVGPRGEPVFDAAVAASEAGPDLTDDAAFNAWQLSIAPLGYASWGAAEQARAAIGHWNLAAVQAYFSVTPPDDLVASLSKVTAPVLAVAGADDRLTGPAQVKALAALFPAGRLKVVDRCGHYPWVEQPAAFRQAVDPFLSDVHGGSAAAGR